jgi:hypothetical protein
MARGERPPKLQERETEYTPEQIERIKFLLTQFETGIDLTDGEQAEKCIGLHGTSLEAFLPFITDGATHGTSQTDAIYTQDNIYPGDLYFYPRYDALPEKNTIFSDPKIKQLYADAEKEARSDIEQNASVYAEMIARQHQLLMQLGFGLNCSDDTRHAAIELVSHLKTDDSKKTTIETDHPGYTIAINFFKKLNKTEDEIWTALHKLGQYQGIVFGIHVNALGDNKLQLGDITEKDLKFNLQNKGLSYRHIIGIEPKGQKEYDFFQKLQEKYADK